jgi:hypothetical protein
MNLLDLPGPCPKCGNTENITYPHPTAESIGANVTIYCKCSEFKVYVPMYHVITPGLIPTATMRAWNNWYQGFYDTEIRGKIVRNFHDGRPAQIKTIETGEAFHDL